MVSTLTHYYRIKLPNSQLIPIYANFPNYLSISEFSFYSISIGKYTLPTFNPFKLIENCFLTVWMSIWNIVQSIWKLLWVHLRRMFILLLCGTLYQVYLYYSIHQILQFPVNFLFIQPVSELCNRVSIIFWNFLLCFKLC